MRVTSTGRTTARARPGAPPSPGTLASQPHQCCLPHTQLAVLHNRPLHSMQGWREKGFQLPRPLRRSPGVSIDCTEATMDHLCSPNPCHFGLPRSSCCWNCRAGLPCAKHVPYLASPCLMISTFVVVVVEARSAKQEETS